MLEEATAEATQRDRLPQRLSDFDAAAACNAPEVPLG